MKPPKPNGLSTHSYYEFTYSRKGDASDARHLARRIKLAEDGYNVSNVNTLRGPFLDLDAAIHALTLCAGNQIIADAPMDMQYLSAAQRISDYFGDKGGVMSSAPEVCRVSAMLFVNQAVKSALESLETALAAGEDHSFAAQVKLVMEEPDRPELPELIGAILYDMQDKVNVYVDHPTLVQHYVIAALQELPKVNGVDLQNAQRKIDHLKELVSGVTKRRLKQIKKVYEA
jgi:hypothetical protein